MRLIGLLSFFDEQPAFLERAIRSYHELGITHLAVLDGPYALFPHGSQTHSSEEEYDTIARVCGELELPLAVDTGRVWDGNEIEKRTALFDLGERHIDDPGRDRYVVIDADEHAVSTIPAAELRQQLLELRQYPTITLRIRTIQDTGLPQRDDPGFALPKIFAAIPGLHCVDNHFTYRAPDGRLFWASKRKRQVPTEHLFGVEIHHYTRHRDPARHNRAGAYYQARGHASAEHKHLPAL